MFNDINAYTSNDYHGEEQHLTGYGCYMLDNLAEEVEVEADTASEIDCSIVTASHINAYPGRFWEREK